MARIMIVDDDASFRRSLARVLEEDGHTVLSEPDGQTALRHFVGEPVDLVISDVFMPHMDGIEFLMRVRSLYPDAQIVMMSGGGPLPAEEVLAASSSLGAAHLLEKPVSSDDVRAVVEEALR